MSGDLRFSVSVDDLPEVEEQKPAGVSWDVVGGRPAQPLIEVAYAEPDEPAGVEVEIESPRRGREVEIDTVNNDEIERLRSEAAAERQWRAQMRSGGTGAGSGHCRRRVQQRA
jgi:hypothetical protein